MSTGIEATYDFASEFRSVSFLSSWLLCKWQLWHLDYTRDHLLALGKIIDRALQAEVYMCKKTTIWLCLRPDVGNIIQHLFNFFVAVPSLQR